MYMYTYSQSELDAADKNIIGGPLQNSTVFYIRSQRKAMYRGMSILCK